MPSELSLPVLPGCIPQCHYMMPSGLSLPVLPGCLVFHAFVRLRGRGRYGGTPRVRGAPGDTCVSCKVGVGSVLRSAVRVIDILVGPCMEVGIGTALGIALWCRGEAMSICGD